jgi:hypothetical protein
MSSIQVWSGPFRAVLVAVMLLLAGDALGQVEWPRTIETERGTVIMYQPQLESFEGDTLEGVAAVSAQPTGGEVVFGGVWMRVRVSIDHDERLVVPHGVEITEVKFPEATDEQRTRLAEILETDLGSVNVTLSLDHLLAMLDSKEAEHDAAPLSAEPPAIVYLDRPALLLIIDGEPRLGSIGDSKLERLVNSPYFVVYDRARKAYYLRGEGGWYVSKTLEGTWRHIPNPPGSIKGLVLDEGEGASVSRPPREIEILVATEPTELVTTDGPPDYAPVEGTGLKYVTDSRDDLFIDDATGRIYVLLSGRWYSAAAASGPWEHVPSGELPEGFRRIPETSAKANVLASIAGTEQANAAIAEALIPQTATVDRRTATVSVVYDGEPVFEPIDGTSLRWAVNTTFAVIRYANGYFCCHEGVWYEAASPSGAWRVATEIPEEIFEIPPTNPLFHVTFVDVYEVEDDLVTVGYTSGYLGAYVYDDSLWYGTGYWYPGWYRAWYCPRPVTYGFAVKYNERVGAWGFRAGARGPNGYLGVGVVGVTVPGGVKPVAGVIGGGSWWGPGGWKTLRNPDLPAPQRRSVYAARGDAARDAAVRAKVASGLSGTQAGGLQRSNNVFVGDDGSVYRRTRDGWERRDGEAWARLPTTLPNQGIGTVQLDRAGLEQMYRARQVGQIRYQRHMQGRRSMPARRRR